MTVHQPVAQRPSQQSPTLPEDHAGEWNDPVAISGTEQGARVAVLKDEDTQITAGSCDHSIFRQRQRRHRCRPDIAAAIPAGEDRRLHPRQSTVLQTNPEVIVTVEHHRQHVDTPQTAARRQPRAGTIRQEGKQALADSSHPENAITARQALLQMERTPTGRTGLSHRLGSRPRTHAVDHAPFLPPRMAPGTNPRLGCPSQRDMRNERPGCAFPQSPGTSNQYSSLSIRQQTVLLSNITGPTHRTLIQHPILQQRNGSVATLNPEPTPVIFNKTDHATPDRPGSQHLADRFPINRTDAPVGATHPEPIRKATGKGRRLQQRLRYHAEPKPGETHPVKPRHPPPARHPDVPIRRLRQRSHRWSRQSVAHPPRPHQKPFRIREHHRLRHLQRCRPSHHRKTQMQKIQYSPAPPGTPRSHESP